MNILYVILGILGGIILLVLLLAAMLPAVGKLQRTLFIDKSTEVIQDKVADFNYYHRWNPWSEREPEANSSVTGEPKKPGHHYQWDGKIIGSGELTLKQFEPGKRVVSDLHFIKPREMKALDIWEFQPKGSGTLVTWKHESKLGYPIGRFFGMFLDKMLGDDFEKGLSNLRDMVEK